MNRPPIRLFPIFRERVWGRDHLAPYFPEGPSQKRIGEVWFTFEQNETSLGISLGELIQREPGVLGSAMDAKHPGICPLLVKLLFTTERLSVQVHPDDAYARCHHGTLGKSEAWYVVDAEPTGEVAVGFREQISPERLADGARTGEIQELLNWRRVQPGDVIYVPAGTVHAIGAGLTICEVQQNSDITYRLYDYGRPRELHLEHGRNVSRLGPHEYRPERVRLAAWREQLAANEYFRMERLRPMSPIATERGLPYYLLLICLAGSGSIAQQHFQAGECWMVPAGGNATPIDGAGSDWILTYTAERPTEALRDEL